MKTVADAAYQAKLTSFPGYQHRWPKTTLKSKHSGLLVNFSRFQAATQISRVNCAENTGDGPRQPAFEIFAINVDFNSLRFDTIRSRSPSYGATNLGTPSKRAVAV